MKIERTKSEVFFRSAAIGGAIGIIVGLITKRVFWFTLIGAVAGGYVGTQLYDAKVKPIEKTDSNFDGYSKPKRIRKKAKITTFKNY